MVNSEETYVDLLVALSWNLAGGTEKNHEKVSQNIT